LPYIRSLAEELRVNRNAISRAYAELESMKLVETIRGKGWFLKESNPPDYKGIRNKMLIEELDDIIVEAHQLDVPQDQLLYLLQHRLSVFDAKRHTTAT
jgi:GntR family transcriptional regulator